MNGDESSFFVVVVTFNNDITQNIILQQAYLFLCFNGPSLGLYNQYSFNQSQYKIYGLWF